MILLAVGVIYHPVDVNAVTGIHSQNEGKPPSAEIRARLNSVGGTKTTNETKQHRKHTQSNNKCDEEPATFCQKCSTLLSGKGIKKLDNLSKIHTYFELSLNNLWAFSHSDYLEPRSYVA